MSPEDLFTVSRSGRILQLQFTGSYATAVYYFVTRPQSFIRRVSAAVGVTGRGKAVFIGGEWIMTETKEDKEQTDESSGPISSTDTAGAASHLGPSSSRTGHTAQQSAAASNQYESVTGDAIPRTIDNPPESVLSELDRRGYSYQGVAATSVNYQSECIDVCSISAVFESIPSQLTAEQSWNPDLPQQAVIWTPPSVSSSTGD